MPLSRREVLKSGVIAVLGYFVPIGAVVPGEVIPQKLVLKFSDIQEMALAILDHMSRMKWRQLAENMERYNFMPHVLRESC